MPGSLPSEPPLVVDVDNVLGCIQSFPKGTSCGRDGLRAQHILDALCGEGSAIAVGLLKAISVVVNLLLEGRCPKVLAEFMAKGSKAVSITSVQDISGPVGSRLAFTRTEPQWERHPMAQPSVIDPTDCNEATPSRKNSSVEVLLGGSPGIGKTFSTRPWKVFWTFWFTDKLIKIGYSGVFIAGQKQMFEMIDADIGHLI
ncbi:hypothetical protein Tco_0686458 [Tanacetum coccineum]